MNTWKTNRKTIIVVCENCGIEFEKTLSEYNRSIKLGRKHFCSLKCNNDNKKIKQKICLCCKKKFIPNESSRKFCSQSCSATYNNKNRKGEKRNFTEKGKKNIIDTLYNRLNIHILDYEKNPNRCIKCNAPLLYKFRKRKFCSYDCKRDYDKRNMSEYQKYYRECQFNFSLNQYPEEFDFNLIEQYGWYQAKNHGNNLNGVSRDHMVSIKYGYEHNISSEIIKHPANCQLMIHNENISKHKNCSITIDELLIKIDIWNKKYT